MKNNWLYWIPYAIIFVCGVLFSFHPSWILLCVINVMFFTVMGFYAYNFLKR